MLLYPILSSTNSYFIPGKTLNMFSKRRRISDPTIWGSSSSGYMDRREWYRQIGAVLMRRG